MECIVHIIVQTVKPISCAFWRLCFIEKNSFSWRYRWLFREMSSDFRNEECQVMSELSKCIKANSKANIISCLSRIKADTKCQKQCIKGGGLNILIGLLRFQNLQVLNAALSLLANMCLTLDVKEKVIKNLNYRLCIPTHLYPSMWSIIKQKLSKPRKKEGIK